MVDATRQLRFYVGLFVALMAFAPTLIFTMAAFQPGAADNALLPPLIGGPVNVVALVFVVRGMISNDPPRAARLLSIGAALTVAGDGLIYGINALIT